MLDLPGGGMTDGPILREGDCAIFEGRPLSQIVRSRINEAHELRLVFEGETGEGTTRSCTEAEFRQLIAAERLVIRAGRGAASPQALLRRSVNTLGASQRNRAYRKAYLARLVDDLHREGMPLTDAGIRNHLARIEEADRRRQRLDAYGTEHSRPNQLIAALPSPYTLLKYRRILAANAWEPIALAPKRRRGQVLDDLALHYNALARGIGMEVLRDNRHASVRMVARLVRSRIVGLHDAQVASGVLVPIPVMSEARYRRLIRDELDPFWVDCVRFGIGEAKSLHGHDDGGLTVTVPGERVEIDSWNIHVRTLDVSRQAFLQMTAEEREKVPRVRRWVIVAIDTATRCVLGFSICKAPDQKAALEALRMTAMDKTQYFELAGIRNARWDQACAITTVASDNGSEFGRTPLRDSRFTQAVTTLGATALATVAGAPALRGRIERFNHTADAYFACHAPGWTAQNPQMLRGRKPDAEACLTDDDLLEAFIAFVALYHATPHRSLGMTPAEKWREATSGRNWDPRLPLPEQLRIACGRHTQVRISRDGIVLDGAVYTSEPLRAGRYGRHGDTVEIIHDPFNMGAISVLHQGMAETVPARDPEMVDLHHADWLSSRAELRARAAVSAMENEATAMQAHGRHEIDDGKGRARDGHQPRRPVRRGDRPGTS